MTRRLCSHKTCVNDASCVRILVERWVRVERAGVLRKKSVFTVSVGRGPSGNGSANSGSGGPAAPPTSTQHNTTLSETLHTGDGDGRAQWVPLTSSPCDWSHHMSILIWYFESSGISILISKSIPALTIRFDFKNNELTSQIVLNVQCTYEKVLPKEDGCHMYEIYYVNQTCVGLQSHRRKCKSSTEEELIQNTKNQFHKSKT